jgi:hypothetical protein
MLYYIILILRQDTSFSFVTEANAHINVHYEIRLNSNHYSLYAQISINNQRE